VARSDWPPIAVMGAGAVGCYFGGMLARAGAPVTLIGRPRHVDAVARAGLWIESPAFREFVPVQAAADPAAAREAALILLAVKTPDTPDATRALAPHLASDAIVVSLQNGVDNARQIRVYLTQRIIPSVVYVSAEMVGPGRVKHNGRGDLVIGTPRGEAPGPELEDIAALFIQAAVPCRVSAYIEADLWAKLTMNCAFNAISALGRARYGRIAGNQAAREVMEQAVLETMAVARAHGVDMARHDLVAAAGRLAEAVPEALSSTAQDIHRGRRTEIDDLNGYVVRRGAALGVPTPVNQTLHGLVKLLEETRAGVAQ
jgi:2-dehydropantoate 2-reductase